METFVLIMVICMLAFYITIKEKLSTGLTESEQTSNYRVFKKHRKELYNVALILSLVCIGGIVFIAIGNQMNTNRDWILFGILILFYMLILICFELYIKRQKIVLRDEGIEIHTVLNSKLIFYKDIIKMEECENDETYIYFFSAQKIKLPNTIEGVEIITERLKREIVQEE